MALDMSQTPNEIKDVIKGWMDDKVKGIHTAMPGKIVSYAAGSNRASVQPNGNFKADDGRNIPYPVIHNVPVQFPLGMGGAAGLTFPIVPGDGCLLVFQETQNDDFLGENKGDSPDPRRHSLNDCIAIPGVYPGAVPSNVSYPGDVCLFLGGTMIRVTAGQVIITGASLSVSGGITAGGDVTGGGISLDNHTHTGVHGETSPAH